MSTNTKSGKAAAFATGALAAALAFGCDSTSQATLVQGHGGSGSAGDGGPSGHSGSAANGGGSSDGGRRSTMNDGGLILGHGFALDAGGHDASCGHTTISAKPPDVSVLLVIDGSASMTDEPTGFGMDKWTAMKSALGDALGAANPSIAFGLELFPAPADPKNPMNTGCEMSALPGITVAVKQGSAGATEIRSALGASGPAGGTPTAEALRRALDYFTKGAGKGLGGDRYVLLATDGGPDCDSTITCTAAECTTNLDGDCPIPDGASCCDPKFGGSAASSRCLDASGTEAQIKALRAAGVATFIVGIPGSEAYAKALDSFAVAGGKALTTGAHKYFAVDAAGGVAALGSALDTITKGVITTCRLVLGSKPPDIGKLNVAIDGEPVPQAGPDGWDVDLTSSPQAIVLKGATCMDVETNGAQKVQVQYGCPTLITR